MKKAPQTSSERFRANYNSIFRQSGLKGKLNAFYEANESNLNAKDTLKNITNIAGNRGYSHAKRIDKINAIVKEKGNSFTDTDKEYISGVLAQEYSHVKGTFGTGKKVNNALYVAKETSQLKNKLNTNGYAQFEQRTANLNNQQPTNELESKIIHTDLTQPIQPVHPISSIEVEVPMPYSSEKIIPFVKLKEEPRNETSGLMQRFGKAAALIAASTLAFVQTSCSPLTKVRQAEADAFEGLSYAKAKNQAEYQKALADANKNLEGLAGMLDIQKELTGDTLAELDETRKGKEKVIKQYEEMVEILTETQVALKTEQNKVADKERQLKTARKDAEDLATSLAGKTREANKLKSDYEGTIKQVAYGKEKLTDAEATIGLRECEKYGLETDLAKATRNSRNANGLLRLTKGELAQSKKETWQESENRRYAEGQLAITKAVKELYGNENDRLKTDLTSTSNALQTTRVDLGNANILYQSATNETALVRRQANEKAMKLTERILMQGRQVDNLGADLGTARREINTLQTDLGILSIRYHTIEDVYRNESAISQRNDGELRAIKREIARAQEEERLRVNQATAVDKFLTSPGFRLPAFDLDVADVEKSGKRGKKLTLKNRGRIVYNGSSLPSTKDFYHLANTLGKAFDTDVGGYEFDCQATLAGLSDEEIADIKANEKQVNLDRLTLLGLQNNQVIIFKDWAGNQRIIGSPEELNKLGAKK